MRKYNIYLLLLVMSLLFSWACKKKEYEPPMAENSHVFLTTNAGDIFLTAIKYDTISLIDLSKGVISRRWDLADFDVDIIDSDNDATCENQVCKVRFFEHGTFSVPVQLTFDENVWVGRNQLQTNVFDTSITFVIVDSVYAVYSMGYVLEQDSYEPSNESWHSADMAPVNFRQPIMGGDDMRFVNLSTGGATADFTIIRPDVGFEFTQAGVVDTFIYRFSSLGVFDVQMIAQSNFDSDFIYHESLVETGPSWRPVTLDVLEVFDVQHGDGMDLIRMQFSRDMLEVDPDDLANAMNIYLEPRNEDSVLTADAAINSVYRDQTLFNTYWIEVNTELYNTDQVQITYDSTTALFETTDAMLFGGMDSVTVTFPRTELISQQNTFDYDFESSNIGWYNCNWPAPWANGNVTANAINIPAYSGNYSLRLVAPPGDNGNSGFAAGSSTGASYVDYSTTMPLTLATGDYIFGAWIHMNQLGTPSTATEPYNVRVWLMDSDDNLLGADGSILYLSSCPEGQWTYRESQHAGRVSAGVYTLIFRVMNQTNTMELDFNIDNIEMYEAQVRR